MNKNILTQRECNFCEEYIQYGNATRAAICAGYSQASASSIAYELMGKKKIRDRIELLRKERQMRTQVTADRIVEMLTRVAFGEERSFRPAQRLAALDKLSRIYGLYDKKPSDVCPEMISISYGVGYETEGLPLEAVHIVEELTAGEREALWPILDSKITKYLELTHCEKDKAGQNRVDADSESTEEQRILALFLDAVRELLPKGRFCETVQLAGLNLTDMYGVLPKQKKLKVKRQIGGSRSSKKAS